MVETRSDSGRTDRVLGRRRLLAALGGLTVAGLAGCDGITNQSFDSSSVGLSAGVQEQLQLGELSRDALSFEKSAADGKVSVKVTSHTAVYSRAVGLGGK